MDTGCWIEADSPVVGSWEEVTLAGLGTILRRSSEDQLRITGWLNASWIASNGSPRVSGIEIANTKTVPAAKAPKRKYAPNAECARKIGVA